MKPEIGIPNVATYDLARSYREAAMVTILGYVDVVPRLYARLNGKDAEVFFDWPNKIVTDREAFAAFVALGGACSMVPNGDVAEPQLPRDARELRIVAAEEHSKLLTRWTEPSQPLFGQPHVPNYKEYLGSVDRLVKAQWKLLRKDDEFKECVHEVRNRLLSQQVLGRDELSKIAKWVSNQIVDPISLLRGYETLVHQGHLSGVKLP